MKNMKVQCPTCSETMKREEEQHVCEAEGCNTSLTIAEAEEQFEDGKLIVIAEDQEIEELLDEEVDTKVNGYENTDTWNASVIAESEYAVYKKFKVAHKKEKLDEAFTTSILKDEVFESVDGEAVNVAEITEHMKSLMKDADQIGVDVVTALFAESELTDEQKDEVISIFESAIDVRVKDARQMLEEKAESDLQKAIEEKQTELEDQAAEYVDHIVEEWREENKLVIEDSLKVEYSKNFLDGLHDLFEQFYVNVPADRFDVVEALDDKVTELESQLAESVKEKETLADQIVESEKATIVADITEGLVETQKERIQELSETVDFESAEDFRKRVEKLKKAFLQENKATNSINEDIVEEEGSEDKKQTPALSVIQQAVNLMDN